MIIKTNKLNETQLSQIIALKEECKIYDNNTIPVYKHLLKKDRFFQSTILRFDNEVLVGFLAGFFFHRDVCEISLLVKPQYRKKGISSDLITQFYPLLIDQNMQYVDFSVPANHVICDYLKKNNFIYKYSEYEMTRKLREKVTAHCSVADVEIRESSPTDMGFILELDNLCFGMQQNSYVRIESFLSERNNRILLLTKNDTPIGKVHIHIYKSYARLTDICISPVHRKQGLGRFIIASAINFVLNKDIIKILLEVEAQNESALNIYTKSGFKVTNTYDFWRISVNSLGKMYL